MSGSAFPASASSQASAPTALLAPTPELPGTASMPSPGHPLGLLRDDDTAQSPTAGIGVFNALAVVLIVALIATWLLRRGGLARGGASRPLQRFLGGGGGGLKVVQSTRLTARSSAHVLEWAQGQWLVVCSDQSTTVVARRSAEGPAVSHPPPGDPT